MAQKIRKTPSGEWLYVSFSVHPEEREKYQEAAKRRDRSVSWWIRNILNREVGLMEDEATNGKNKSVAVEDVSSDRA